MSSAVSSAPPARQLSALRAEIDAIDDALHDLLMRRAEVVAEVGASGTKGSVPLRPGREAAIVRRLVARNRGALDPSMLVRLWRELLSGSSAQQRPMAIVTTDAALLPTVRAQFGALVAVSVAPAALDAVRAGAAMAAVMPWPGAWWTELLADTGPRLSIVARLPFWRAGGANPGCVVVTAAAPDPSGLDRSIVATGSPDRFGDVVRVGPGLADVAGFLTPDDPRLGSGATLLGAYAVPIGETT